jgi:hypothetical protein
LKPPPPKADATKNIRRFTWAELLERVFRIDVLVCNKCGGPRALIAMITQPPVIRAILDALELRVTPPAITKARAPPTILDFPS